MRNLRVVGLLAGLLLCFPVYSQESASIHLPALVTTPLRHAANRLGDYTGIPVSAEGTRQVRVELERPSQRRDRCRGLPDPKHGSDIVISANNETGLANGVYTLLRSLMIEHSVDPFARKWDIEEQPHFSFRSMMVAPYRFGGSYGYAVTEPRSLDI